MKRRRLAAGGTVAILVMLVCATASGPSPTDTSSRTPARTGSVSAPTLSQAQWTLKVLQQGVEVLALLEAPLTTTTSTTTDSAARIRSSQGCTAPQSKGHGYEVVADWSVDIPVDRRTTALAKVHAGWVYQHGYGIDFIQTGFLGGYDPATGIRMRIDATRAYEPVAVQVRSPCSPVESRGTAAARQWERRVGLWVDGAQMWLEVTPTRRWGAHPPRPVGRGRGTQW